MLDQELLIIAIIVITFLNWLSTKLKQRSARKKGILPEDEEQQIDSQAPPQITGVSDVNNEIQEEMGFKEFLAALSGNEPPTQVVPIPLPDSNEKLPPLKSEPANLEKASNDDISKTYARKPIDRLEIRTSSIHPIIRKLRQEGGAKEAIILGEILRKPIALRQEY